MVYFSPTNKDVSLCRYEQTSVRLNVGNVKSELAFLA